MALGAGVKVIVEVVRFGYSCTTSIGSRVLPQSITQTLQGELAPILFLPLSSVHAQQTCISHVYLALQIAMHLCTFTTLHTAARVCLALFCTRAHNSGQLGPCFQACSRDYLLAAYYVMCSFLRIHMSFIRQFLQTFAMCANTNTWVQELPRCFYKAINTRTLHNLQPPSSKCCNSAMMPSAQTFWRPAGRMLLCKHTGSTSFCSSIYTLQTMRWVLLQMECLHTVQTDS